MPRKIEVTELILRDGHQNLLATRMALEDMVPACEDIDNAGFWSVECWGGATFDACIRFLNEDPWERLRTFRKLMPNSRLQMLLRGQNLLSYRHYEDSVVERFVAKSADNGMDVFRVFDALNDVRNVKCAIAAVKKPGKHAQGTICYTISPLHTVEGYLQMAKELMDLGCDSLCIKDMAALLKPQPAYDIVKAIKESLGEQVRIHVHVHATAGAGDRMKEVLLEVPRVRKDAAYPPLVTPSSQIVGTQAVFNVLMGRYKVITAEFADLMLGYHGKTLGERDLHVKLDGKKHQVTVSPA
jgi:methylmalonyl-CoA carboxyltransferase 5S subunit